MTKKSVGYEINEGDINRMIHVYKILDPKKANRDDAIKFLHNAHIYSQFAAVQIIEELETKALKKHSRAKKKIKKQ